MYRNIPRGQVVEAADRGAQVVPSDIAFRYWTPTDGVEEAGGGLSPWASLMSPLLGVNTSDRFPGTSVLHYVPEAWTLAGQGSPVNRSSIGELLWDDGDDLASLPRRPVGYVARRCCFLMIEAPRGTPVGLMIAFRGDDISSRVAGIGYAVFEHHQRRGIATAATRKWCSFLHDEFGVSGGLLTQRADDGDVASNGRVLNRLEADVYGDNVASLRVLEKCGFRREGTVEGGQIKFGIPRDRVLLGMPV